jgi:hypothetical protein
MGFLPHIFFLDYICWLVIIIITYYTFYIIFCFPKKNYICIFSAFLYELFVWFIKFIFYGYNKIWENDGFEEIIVCCGKNHLKKMDLNFVLILLFVWFIKFTFYWYNKIWENDEFEEIIVCCGKKTPKKMHLNFVLILFHSILCFFGNINFIYVPRILIQKI